MIEKVAILQVTPVYPSFIGKWCIDELSELNYKTQIVDLSKVLRPDLYEISKEKVLRQDLKTADLDYIALNSIKEIDEYFRTNKNAFFFITFSNYYYERKVFFFLKHYRIKYANLCGISSELGIDDAVDNPPLRDRLSVKHLYRAVYNRILKRLNNYQPEFLALSAKTNEKYQINNNNIKKHVSILRIHSYDYENYLRTNKYDNNGRAYCVFLDSYVPFHPDFLIDQNRKINPDKYYSELNNIFKTIEEMLDLEIIVAAHPRANNEIERKYFNNKIIFGKTSELVKGADLVLAHFSNSIAFAIMAYKPVVIINNETISEIDFFNIKCQKYANKLSLKMIHDSNDVTDTLTKVNTKKYKQFINEKLTYKERSTPCLWKVIMTEAERAINSNDYQKQRRNF